MSDLIKSIQMPRSLHARVQEYAEANEMSVSEAVRELMDVYATNDSAVVSGRLTPRSKRVTIWITPERFVAFTRALAARNTARRKKGLPRMTNAQAIEVAFDILERGAQK